MKQSVGLAFFASCLASGNVASYLQLGRMEQLFDYVPAEKELAHKFDSYVRMHGELPSEKIIAEDFGQLLPKADGAITYWHKQVVDRHLKRGMIKISADADEMMKAGEPAKVLDFMTSSLNKLVYDQFGNKLVDFRDAHDMIEGQWNTKKQSGVSLGFKTLDDKLGFQAQPGDVMSMVGRPGQGKTYLMLASAYHVWSVEEKVPLFISMEMKPSPLVERLAAIKTKTPYDWVKKNEWPSHDPVTHQLLSQKNHPAQKQFLKNLSAVKNVERPFYIVDGSLTATVDDIAALVQQLRPSIVYIDGAYLIKDKVERDIYKRVAKSCEALKSDVAERLGVPVFCSWQFSREAAKVKKGDKIGLEHIGYSDVIGQISSLVLGLFEDDSVETIVRRCIDILKGRSGEVGKFYTNWNFKTMDFSEIDPDAEAGELEHIG